MISKLQSWRRSQSGATVIEYSLIAAGISLTIVAATYAFGEDIAAFFDQLGEWLD